MHNDIVARLRDCTCVPHGDICREAADEIERLRGEMLMYAELMNKANNQIKHLRLTVEAWLQYSQRAERDIAEFRDELARITKSTGMGFAHNHRVIDRLTAERDEARREICRRDCALDTDWLDSPFPMQTSSPRMFADLYGWDCFKEGT